MYSLYNEFSDEKFSMVYLGDFSDNITTMLIDLSETFLTKDQNLSKLWKKASMLVTESFQNVVRHKIQEQEIISKNPNSKDFYQISVIDDRVIISSANVIEDQEAEKLNSHIDHINSFDTNDLKELKQDVLRFGSVNKKGGAGLGLIEIVRKSGLPLKKKFVPLASGYKLLLLGLEIPMDKDLKTHKTGINSTGEFYRQMTDNGILLLYKGDFSSSSNSNIIEMLINNFLKEGEVDPSKLKNIVAIIEVLQNVSIHGKSINGSKEGIFAIRNIDDELFIECGNFVKSENHENLKKILKSIKACSSDELENLYKQKLSASHLSEKHSGGLGLIEMARFSKNTFSYNFEETPDNQLFYSIKFKTE
jgi:hypothetical protein